MRKTMKLSMCVLLTTIGLLAPSPGAFGDGVSASSVTLPLDDYLLLVDAIERAEQARGVPPEPAVAELAMQATTLTLNGSVAEIDASYQVTLSGRPTRPVVLPVTGLVESATVESPRGAALHRKAGELLLVAPEPGSYVVRVRGRAELESDDGVSKLKLATSRAPVATLDLDLPADLSWTCDQAVVVEDTSAGERRRLRLAPMRGKRASLELRRDAAGAIEAETRARAVVVTVARLGAQGVKRHDLVLYEVTRGELSRFAVALPEAGQRHSFEVERATTDEGPALPIVEAGRLEVERRRRLSTVGHLELTFRPLVPFRDQVPLPALTPMVPVRSRYLVLASDRAGEVGPHPAEAWSRVDLEDLPRGPRAQIAALGPNSVWRRTEAVAEPWLRVQLYDTVEALPAVVGQRSTSTVLTVDGSLVHRDVFDLRRAGAALELSLPPGATLWSVRVDGQAVRPIERGPVAGGNEIVVPLAFKAEGETEVELVTVEARRIERGASRLEVELARVASPVLEHQWRLLLPEQHRYRLAAGDLQPAPPHEAERVSVASEAQVSVIDSVSGDAGIAGKVTDDDDVELPGVTVTVTGAGGQTRSVVTDRNGNFGFLGLAPGSYRVVAELEGFWTQDRTAWVPAGRTARIELTMPIAEVVEELVVTSHAVAIDHRSTAQVRDEIESRQRQQAAQAELASMQGLVGGVKPLAVKIPESGKLLLLAGVLPPPAVRVELEVRARR